MDWMYAVSRREETGMITNDFSRANRKAELPLTEMARLR